VTSAETDAGPNNAAEPRRTSRGTDRYQGAFRRQLRAVAIGLLLVNLALGLFARQQQHETIDHAINIFDTAFISTNYVHLAQMSFQRYVDERVRAAEPIEVENANELLDTVLDDMDVVIEKSNSPRSRDQAQEIKANIAALPNIGMDRAALADRLGNIQQELEQLGKRNTAVGLMARDQIEEFSLKSDFLLLGSIVTSIMLAGLALILLHRMINSMKQRSSAQLSAALEGMPQGLSMFDGEQRLIVCNANYAAMYGLRPELTEPGTSLRTILEHRVGTGTSPVNADDFVADTLASASHPTPGVAEQELNDGRIISVISAPLSTGGGVTIHMDVTEKRNSEKQIAFRAHHDALTGLAKPRSIARAYRGEPETGGTRSKVFRAVLGPRPFQGRQRHAGPFRRRCLAMRGFQAPARARARGGFGVADGRRRVLDRAVPDRAADGRLCGLGHAPCRIFERAVRPRRPSRRDRRERRHRDCAR
jgi:PAS domain-containing protein